MEWKPWLELAGQLPAVALQEKVSAALDALPRGREPSPPGERFRRTVLAAMPDIEAMELADRFFEVGPRWWGRRIRSGSFWRAVGSVSASGSSRPASGLVHRPEGRAPP
jgi:hypothetical protein